MGQRSHNCSLCAVWRALGRLCPVGKGNLSQGREEVARASVSLETGVQSFGAWVATVGLQHFSDSSLRVLISI